MTAQFTVAEAKAKLSKLIDLAVAGEEVVIVDNGRPLVQLKPIEAERRGQTRAATP